MKTFDVAKQFNFALASALTATVKEAQTAVIADIRNTFTVRNTWVSPSNAMGIKILSASKADLSAAVVTRADWLALHETGGTKSPRGAHVAVPTRFVRRTKREIIQKGQRPRGLNPKRSVVLPLKDGNSMIFERRKGRLVPLYRLIPRAEIKRAATLTEQTERIVDKRFEPIFWRKFADAVRTAK